MSAPDPAAAPEAAEAAPEASVARLSWVALSAYAIPAGTVGMMYTTIYIAYAKYATDVLLISGAAMGAILLFSRVWDAVSDPLVGYLSDVTRSPLGRRRSWILVSPIFLGAAALAMWAPPGFLDGNAQILWVLVAVLAFYTAYTAFEVPHTSLGAELSVQSSERNRLFGGRQLAKTAVGLLGAAAVGSMILETEGRETEIAVTAMIAMGVVVVASVVAGAFVLPPEPADHAGRGSQNPLKAVRDLWSNRYARLILLTYLVESFGMGGIGVLTPYVVEYVMLRPDLLTEMLGVYVMSGVLGIPVWVGLANRFEKRKLWLFAMAQAAFGFGLLVFLGENGWPVMVASSLLAGMGGSCGSVLGTSIKAEVIDYDELLTGERKEGTYFAGWAFVHKLAGALMAGVALLVLDAAGYVANEPQTDLVKFWMVALMGGAPILGYTVGIMVFRRFDLSEARHREILAELAARRAAESHAPTP